MLESLTCELMERCVTLMVKNSSSLIIPSYVLCSLIEKSNSMFIITQWSFFIALVPTKQMYLHIFERIMTNQRWDIWDCPSLVQVWTQFRGFVQGHLLRVCICSINDIKGTLNSWDSWFLVQEIPQKLYAFLLASGIIVPLKSHHQFNLHSDNLFLDFIKSFRNE